LFGANIQTPTITNFNRNFNSNIKNQAIKAIGIIGVVLEILVLPMLLDLPNLLMLPRIPMLLDLPMLLEQGKLLHEFRT
jgi:hypothetical protein